MKLFIKENPFAFSIATFFLMLGVFLRFYKLDFQSLWFDELFIVLRSSHHSFFETFLSTLKDPNPSLYGLVLHFWIKVFSDSPMAVRSLSAVCGSLGLLYLYWLYIKEKREYILFSLIIYSISFGAIYFSQEARSYSLLYFFSILITFLIIKFLEKPTSAILNYRDCAQLLIVSILMSYSHFFGLIFVCHVFFILVLSHLYNKNFHNILRIFVVGGILLIVYIPELYKLIFVLPKSGAIDWVPVLNHIQYFEFINFTFFLLPYKGISIGFVVIILLLGFLLVQYKSLFEFFSKETSNSDLKIIKYLGLLILLFIASTSLVSLYKTILTGRNLFTISFPLVVLISMLLEKSRLLSEGKKILGLSILSLFLVLGISKYYYKPFKMQFRQAAEYLISDFSPGDKVYAHSQNAYYNYYIRQYKKDETIKIIDFPRSDGKLSFSSYLNLAKNQKLYLLETKLVGTFTLEDIQAIANLGLKIETIKFGEIQIYQITKI